MSAGQGWSAREIALAGLLRCSEPPAPGPVAMLVDRLGAEDAWAAIASGRAPGPVASAVAPRLQGLGRADLEARARADLSAAAVVGAHVIGPGDAAWPADRFAALEWVRPYEDCGHAARPLALYVRGDLRSAIGSGAIAVVGSRAATPYGVRIATQFAADAVGAGCAVISGAAFGIDAAAHRGALHAAAGWAPSRADGPPGAAVVGDDGIRVSAGGPGTVAVLSCGIDRSYPAAHRSLIDAIARDGAVVSEYPPASVPARHRFLVRNRLIAALGEATVVVEAGRRSGSLNTATTAANLGRPVLAVPGPVSSAMSVGCHELIRDGKASLVTGWADAAVFLGPLAPDASPHRVGERPTDALDLVAGRVHDAIPARGAVTVDDLAAEAALPVPDVIGALAVLATAGLATRRDGMWARA